jgi:hypothetical protein
MRWSSILAICVLVGCSSKSSEPLELNAPLPSKNQLSSKTLPAILHSDEEIERLFILGNKKEPKGPQQSLEIVHFDVVPNGKTYERSKVFKKLSIEEGRIGDFRHERQELVVYLLWQVSKSYDISCMTAFDDRKDFDLELSDPRRKVYGIKLLKRVK